MLGTDFVNCILPFDSDAAGICIGVAAAQRRLDRPVSQADCQIVAILLCRRIALATRDTADFEWIGIEDIDPWAGT